MGDLELNLLFNLGGHPAKLRENKAIDKSASGQLSRTKLAFRAELRSLRRTISIFEAQISQEETKLTKRFLLQARVLEES